jgi:adenylate cyclase
VHASIFNSLLNNDIDTFATASSTLFYLLLFSVLATVLIYRLRSLFAQVSALGLLMLALFILIDTYFQHHTILPAPHLFIAIVLYAGYTTLYRFLKERKQNDYIKNLFSKYVDKDVLKELLTSGAEIRLGGEKRDVTVLFSDLRGFTTLSESMTPEELTSTLNAYLSAMSPIILKEKGTIDKYIGDAIMAFWNAPLFTPNHQNHAVLSALIMQDTLKEFNKKNNTSLAMGVGIHTCELYNSGRCC